MVAAPPQNSVYSVYSVVKKLCELGERRHFVILGEWFGNTGLEASVMGERWGRCGCKDCLHRVKGRWATGVRS